MNRELPSGSARSAQDASALRVLPGFGFWGSGSPLPWCTLVAGLFALVASTPVWARLFEWTRDGNSIEAWRIFTAHFSHWSSEHLVWDLTIFLAFGGLLEMHRRRDFARVVISSGLVLGLLLPFAYPEMTAYRGLSGIDCALASAVAMVHLRRPSVWDRVVGAAIAAFVLGKVLLEFATASSFFVDGAEAGFTSLPLAHALGALVGCAAVFWIPSGEDNDLSVDPPRTEEG